MLFVEGMVASNLGRFVVAFNATETGKPRNAHNWSGSVAVIRVKRLRRRCIQVEIQMLLRDVNRKLLHLLNV